MYVSIIFTLLAAAYGMPHGSQNATMRNSGYSCGKAVYKPNALSSFIVGGKEAAENSWPWQALLTHSYGYMCGGTLVENPSGGYVVVTAAHCVESGASNIASLWTVTLGSHRQTFDSLYTVKYGVSRIVMHENYRPNTINNDIAIMVLSKDVVLSDGIIPACLPTRLYDENEMCVVTGWGTTEEGGRVTDRLQEVYKPLLSESTCRNKLGTSFKLSSMMCAGFDQGGADACQGDSGGPLVCNRNGQYELAGVVSWGYGCARPELPGVYANTYNFNNWLLDNMSKL